MREVHLQGWGCSRLSMSPCAFRAGCSRLPGVCIPYPREEFVKWLRLPLGFQTLTSPLPPSSLAEPWLENDCLESPRATAQLSPIWRTSLFVNCGVTFPAGNSFKQRRAWSTQRQSQTLHQPPSPVLSWSIIAMKGNGLIYPQRRFMKLFSLKSSCALEQ